MSARSTDLIYKYIIIGDQMVGKTCLVNRFVNDTFNENYQETIGVDFQTQYFEHANQRMRIQWWDAGGNEKYRSIVSAYFRSTAGILGVYDLTSKASFKSLKVQLNCLKNHMSIQKPVVYIIGNKADLEECREVCFEEAEEYAKANGFLFREVSAKKTTKIYKILGELVRETKAKKQNINNRCSSARSFNREKSTNCLTSSSKEGKTETPMSARSLIDAKSNSLLMNSSSFLSYRNDSESKKLSKLNEQITNLKSELEKKDKLIYELSVTKETKSNVDDTYLKNALFTIDSNCIQYAGKELAAACKNHEQIALELTEEKAKNETKEAVIKELNLQIELKNSEIETLNAQIESQQTKITNFENDLTNFTNTSIKSQQTITSLEEANQQLSLKITELENLAESNKDIKAEFETSFAKLNKHISEICRSLSAFFSIEIAENMESFETIHIKVQDLIELSRSFKVNEEQLNQKIIHLESEIKVNNETIQHLVTELNNYEKEILLMKQNYEIIKIERDSVLNAKQLSDTEIEMIREKYTSSLSQWESKQNELDVYRSKCSAHEANIQNYQAEILSHQKSYSVLLDEIASAMSDEFVRVEANSKEIIEKIQLLISSSKSRGMTIVSLEDNVNQLNAKLDQEVSQRSELNTKYNTFKSKVSELEESYKSLEASFQSALSKCEALSTERLQFSTFVSNMKKLLKMNGETNFALIFTKVDQLSSIASDYTKLEKEKVDLIAAHTKELSSLKEQLNNKEIHIDLMRKKMVDLEEGKFGKSELKIDSESQLFNIKKLKVKIEKLNSRIDVLNAENVQLKSQFLDVSSLQAINLEQSVEKSKLFKQINELNSLNKSQIIKISELKDEIDNLNSEVAKTSTSSNKSIHALSTELRSYKQELEKSRNREKELLEFRDSVAKKIGLEVQTLNLADYEIISKIEKSLRPTYVHAGVCVPVAENYELKSHTPECNRCHCVK